MPRPGRRLQVRGVEHGRPDIEMLDASPPNLLHARLADADDRLWLVEKHGRVLAVLEDACWTDLFWVTYRVVDLTVTDDDKARLFSASFWHEAPLPRFIHLFTGEACDSAFAGGITPTETSPWVAMRSLRLPSVG